MRKIRKRTIAGIIAAIGLLGLSVFVGNTLVVGKTLLENPSVLGLSEDERPNILTPTRFFYA